MLEEIGTFINQTLIMFCQLFWLFSLFQMEKDGQIIYKFGWIHLMLIADLLLIRVSLKLLYFSFFFWWLDNFSSSTSLLVFCLWSLKKQEVRKKKDIQKLTWTGLTFKSWLYKQTLIMNLQMSQNKIGGNGFMILWHHQNLTYLL